MTERPDYIPPIRCGEGRWPRSPRGVLAELLMLPPAAAAFAIALLVHGHTLGGAVALAFFLVDIVQAVIYVPRALRAVRSENHGRVSSPSSGVRDGLIERRARRR